MLPLFAVALFSAPYLFAKVVRPMHLAKNCLLVYFRPEHFLRFTCPFRIPSPKIVIDRQTAAFTQLRRRLRTRTDKALTSWKLSDGVAIRRTGKIDGNFIIAAARAQIPKARDR